MKRTIVVAALAAAAFAAAGCDKPQTSTAYINSGASATPAMPATQAPSGSPAETPAEPLKASPAEPAREVNPSAPAVSDTASPSAAPPQK
jgi:hypothetical protein